MPKATIILRVYPNVPWKEHQCYLWESIALGSPTDDRKSIVVTAPTSIIRTCAGSICPYTDFFRRLS